MTLRSNFFEILLPLTHQIRHGYTVPPLLQMTNLLRHAQMSLKHLSGVLVLPNLDAMHGQMVHVVVATSNAQRLVSSQTQNLVCAYLNVFAVRVVPLVTAERHVDDQSLMCELLENLQQN